MSSPHWLHAHITTEPHLSHYATCLLTVQEGLSALLVKILFLIMLCLVTLLNRRAWQWAGLVVVASSIGLPDITTSIQLLLLFLSISYWQNLMCHYIMGHWKALSLIYLPKSDQIYFLTWVKNLLGELPPANIWVIELSRYQKSSMSAFALHPAFSRQNMPSLLCMGLPR